MTEFRAGMVVGSGSLSFEMLRHLTERLPLMICPRWVFTKTQPIAIRDVLSYLLAALDHPESRGKIIEIGSPDVLTYADMMMGYAHARRLKRLLIPVPVLTPSLSSHWVHWMTPVPWSIARPLIEGLRNELDRPRSVGRARSFPRSSLSRLRAQLNWRWSAFAAARSRPSGATPWPRARATCRPST